MRFSVQNSSGALVQTLGQVCSRGGLGGFGATSGSTDSTGFGGESSGGGPGLGSESLGVRVNEVSSGASGAIQGGVWRGF